MAETEMVERVARVLCGSPKAWKHLDGHRQAGYRKQARAAIEAIFKGSRFTECGGMTVVANPDFPAQYWDGEQMREVIDADLSPPSKD